MQRVLAAAGYGSRRSCEALITEARVEVDGEIVVELGTQVDPDQSKIFVDGIRLRRQPLAYFLLNKPVGVVTTNHDPQGRPRVVDLIPAESRVYPVGRLDRSSEGLILLTNDGELAQQLTHPRYGVRKVYQVTVAGQVTRETMKNMQEGIFIAEGRVRVEGARIRKARSRATDLEITLREGKNREIRRILARFGHKVQRLRRIAIGPLRLGEMPVGAHRPLTAAELEKLRNEMHAARKRARGDTAPGEPAESSSRRPRGQQGAGGKAGRKGAAKASRKPRSGGARPGQLASGPRTPQTRGGQAGKPSSEFDLDAPRANSGAVIGGEPSTPPASPPRQGSPAGNRGAAKGKGKSRRGGRSSSETSSRKASGGGRKPTGKGNPRGKRR